MDTSDSRRKRKSSRARERYEARKRRREGGMAVRMDDTAADSGRGSDRFVTLPSGAVREALQPVELFLRDTWWHLTHNPAVLRGALGAAALVFFIYFLLNIFSGSIMPRVRAMGVDLGGMSVEEAQTTLAAAWANSVQITLVVNGETYDQVRPDALGIRLDPRMTAQAAKDAGIGAFPFGKIIKPVVTMDRLDAQTFLLDTADQVDTPPFNAGYALQDGSIQGIDGRRGYIVDVNLTLEYLAQNLPDVVSRRRLELVMVTLEPDVIDPNLFINDVRRLVGDSGRPSVRGYDPYANQVFTWEIPLGQYLSWLAASRTGLTLREDVFRSYIPLLNETLNEPGEELRYLAVDETANLLREAISSGRSDVNLRIRYRDTIYTVQMGDTGFAIGRKTGVPFELIKEANPGKDLSMLTPGEPIRVPTRDVTMLEQPIAHKRIIVDLDNQYLVAYENNQVVFEWSISSGLSNAPTSPGIYQILNHDEVAYGGSINYCDDITLVCGQWEMNWFMGIYEVIPGLLNGFHGSVLLPNGNTLGDAQIGTPVTFGCIMSSDEQAKLLYDWAEIGTVVEIISHEYKPYSDLAKLTRERIEQRKAQEISA
jgi:lipoprotein-anchoring transpeptidase ErfK/SrfK